MAGPSCLIVAGEQSGEDICLGFLDALRDSLPGADLWGVGGDGMAAKGFRAVHHLRDFSTWGAWEALRRVPFYLRALRGIRREARRTGTRAAVLIDFQDFNMRLARGLAAQGVRVLQVVAPQAWAWRPGRAAGLARDVHTLFTVLPFEKAWFERRGVPRVVTVPHPVLGRFGDALPKGPGPPRGPGDPFTLALLPGSREGEVSRLLPEFAGACGLLRGRGRRFSTVLVRARSVDPALYAPWDRDADRLADDPDLGGVLAGADYALAASGTVVLSCALFGVPAVSCYRSSLLTEFVATSLVRYGGHTSIPNLVHGEGVLPELMGDRANRHDMALRLEAWLDDPAADLGVRRRLLSTRGLVAGGGGPPLADHLVRLVGEAVA